jgi:hypothetical protein
MLARFRVLLPFAFHIPFDAGLEPASFDFEDYRATIYPPMQANVASSVADVASEIPFLDAIANLDAARLMTPTQAVMVNGKETVTANMLQIDFIAARDFERPRGGSARTDPPVDLFFKLANKLIQKLRSFASLPHVRPLTSSNALGWRIEYLTDVGEQLEKDPDKSRSVQSGVTRWRTNVITREVWKNAANDFREFEPYVWDSLLLDAYAQADDVNAAIVLANAALESAIDFALETLARESAVSQQSFEWLINRSGDYIRQPSVKEKFDELLFLVSGYSLKKEESNLWESLKDLRFARNSMVHQGKAVLKKGKKAVEKEIDTRLARELLGKAKEIIDWLESLLPADIRREKLKTPYHLGFNVNARGDDEKEMYLVGVKSSHSLNLALLPSDE